MAITYKWTIPMTEYNKADGGIFCCHWRVEAVDGDHSASSYGTAGFTPDATAPGFKPYDQLTEADVLVWVWGSVDKTEMETALQSQTDAQKAPVTLTGTPW